MEILEQKHKMSTIRQFARWAQPQNGDDKGKHRELEERAVEIIQTEEKKKVRNKAVTRDVWANVKGSSAGITES